MPNIVVIGGSAGSISVLKVILKGLPAGFPAAVLVVVHIGARDSILPALLQKESALPVRHAMQGDPIVAGEVLLAPPDVHLTVARDQERLYAHLSRGPKENHSRPAIDPLFRSAAAACGADAIAVVLSGFLDDGTVGLQAIKACGGIALVQDPDDAEIPEMPASAMQYAAVDGVLRMDALAPALVALVNRVPPDGVQPSDDERQPWIDIENRMLSEGSEMEALDDIGARVPLTCPECGGAIWEIRNVNPLRYRCHTGHAFTARSLQTLQRGTVEEALWAAVRALHEQDQLFQQMRQRALEIPADNDADVDDYQTRAEQAREHAQLLRELIATRMRIGPA